MPRSPCKARENATPPRRIGLFCRAGDPAARQALRRASEFLKRAGVEVRTPEQVQAREPVDACLSFGGDGTLLHLARLMAPMRVPVLGVNFGRIGYLCAVSEEGLEEALRRIAEGRFQIDRRTMVRATVYQDGARIWEQDALNEVLVGGSTRTLTLEVSIDGERFGTLRGDGIIVASRTGSTAYAFSAGGSILMLDALVLVASNAVFSSSIRSLVLPLSSTVRIANRTRVADPYVITDGQIDFRIGRDTEVEVTRSPLPALLIDLGLESPVEKLSRGFAEQQRGP